LAILDSYPSRPHLSRHPAAGRIFSSTTKMPGTGPGMT
jgi:hypothetical protein